MTVIKINRKNPFVGKIIKGTVIFIIAVIVLQALSLLFMTPEGLGVLYPFVLSAKSREIQTGDNDLGEYFALHNDIEDAGLIILSADLGTSSTYKLAADYLCFLSKFTNISAAATYVPNLRVRSISEAALAGNYELFSEAVENQRVSKSISEEFFGLAEKLYSINGKMTPDAKIPLVGIKGHDELKDILSSLTSDLFTKGTGLSGEHMEIFNAKTPEEYAEMLKKHEDQLYEILEDKFTQYAETVEDVLNGTIEEAFALRNLVKHAPPGEESVFALLPSHLCSEDSKFIKGAEELYGKVVVTDTVYYDSRSYTQEGNVPIDDGFFPDFSDGIRIASAEELSGFRKYYNTIVGDSDTIGIGNAGVSTFFIVNGSAAVTFDKPTDRSETVLVAPGA